MRIGVDLRYVYPDHVHGIGRYSLELVRAMVARAPHHEWVAFVRDDFAEGVTRMPGVREVPCAPRPASLGTWFRMRRRIRAERLDVFHALFPILPRRLPEVRTVVTFYDLQAITIRGFGAGRGRAAALASSLFYRMAYRHAYREADSVLAISHATANALRARYGARPVGVTHAGLTNGMSPAAPVLTSLLTSEYGIRGPFLLTVANYRPHKNIAGLLRAYAAYRNRCGSLAAPLVIVGVKDRFFPAIQTLIADLGLATSVRCVGFVPDHELPHFYRLAAAFVTLSLCEGFGLPVLEAMSHGTPVVAADRGSLPEVVGRAGLLVERDALRRRPRAFAPVYVATRG